ncbi:MAG: terpene cyclase/mutase family protein [Planctomycetes bacterium]|nr:terpene cyclase/mutase family protein [Planctomycetota bacterium]
MNRILGSAFGLFVLTPVLASCQVPVAQPGARPGDEGAARAEAPTRSKGTIFKSEVDLLIGRVRDAARNDGLPALGGTSVATTAKILAAMGHCHRRYHTSDGPVVRPSLQFLIEHRQADGSFGDADATAWVVEALSVIDPDGYRDEVHEAQQWLQQHGRAEPVFRGETTRLLAQVRADVFPQQLGKDAAAQAQQLAAAAGAPLARDEAADVLVRLVACQVANKLLDAAQDPKQGAGATYTPAQQKAFAWLWSQQHDGVFSVTMGGKSIQDAGLTGFGLLALQTKPKALRSAEEQATIEQGLRWLLSQQRDDGSFSEQLPNYVTCVATAALSRWDDPAVKPALQKAQRAILAFQNAESSGYQKSDRDYGSIGYGGSQRGDLSNTHFALEALKATGLPADHEAFAKAVVFLQRTQNLKSVNDFTGKVPDPERDGVILDSTPGDDGGAVYYPGDSAAGYILQPDGKSVSRSYGSMTYALLKSYTLAGLPGDDPRVQAAVKWIQANWTLAMNPGSDPALGEKVKYQGLYYYYMVLAQALDLVGLKQVTVPGKDGDGTEQIDWRQALRAQLESQQQADGSWVNGKNPRWMEGLPLLCTCYAMVALERCR